MKIIRTAGVLFLIVYFVLCCIATGATIRIMALGTVFLVYKMSKKGKEEKENENKYR